MRNSLFSSRHPWPRVAAVAAPLVCAILLYASVHPVRADDNAASEAQPSVAVQTVRVQRAAIAQPVRGFGIVAATASNLTTINLPYLSRIVQMRVQAGETVKRGTPLFVVQADPAAVLAATQARSALTLAQGELVRTRSLYDKGLATQSQLASASKAVDDAREALAAQNQTGITSGNKVVTAPFDGVVLQLSAAQGDQVQAGAAILQLASGASRDARANVTLGVEPTDAASIHPGDIVTLHGLSTALAQTSIEGRVVLVGAAIDPQSQLVNIGVTVPLAQTPFIPGTRVSGDIATRTGTHWIVPRAAVLQDGQHAYVFQITPQNKARRVAVSIAVENGERYGVDGPLDPMLGVVSSGNYELKDGMAVRAGGDGAR
ncbi:RND family efflux transporter MFP subunit [Paraburkholderia sp. HC6.4b]|uniref:efflux RND transporter periplasmic adaptor subunit n=1 Tax=unclassified Paraburkholderia TaxID=2615204 RepID=UPI00161E1279|nr:MULTISPECIES: efflux RND transporter periplasmic adaptor subunit [unclassified Paraburkholderia]MBB5413287.1 RND family efflux transporter MFP subunit [Paraburkholderia sp. HC6.4b]MBB5455568.1 RND family efflux transporter MFP subunit [Paraburkholderia sp. Kb1A]